MVLLSTLSAFLRWVAYWLPSCRAAGSTRLRPFLASGRFMARRRLALLFGGSDRSGGSGSGKALRREPNTACAGGRPERRQLNRLARLRLATESRRGWRGMGFCAGGWVWARARGSHRPAAEAAREGARCPRFREGRAFFSSAGLVFANATWVPNASRRTRAGSRYQCSVAGATEVRHFLPRRPFHSALLVSAPLWRIGSIGPIGVGKSFGREPNTACARGGAQNDGSSTRRRACGSPQEVGAAVEECAAAQGAGYGRGLAGTPPPPGPRGYQCPVAGATAVHFFLRLRGFHSALPRSAALRRIGLIGAIARIKLGTAPWRAGETPAPGETPARRREVALPAEHEPPVDRTKLRAGTGGAAGGRTCAVGRQSAEGNRTSASPAGRLFPRASASFRGGTDERRCLGPMDNERRESGGQPLSPWAAIFSTPGQGERAIRRPAPALRMLVALPCANTRAWLHWPRGFSSIGACC